MLSALGSAGHPQDISFLSGLIQREIVYRILRGPEGSRLRAIATLGDQSHRTAKVIAWVRANYAKPQGWKPRKNRGHGCLHAASPFPGADRHDPLQYQKQLRLQAARERMLMDGMDAASAHSRSDTRAPANSIAI